MGTLAKELGKKLAVFVVGSFIAGAVCKAIENRMNGLDAFGKKKILRQKTTVDWNGDVHLGYQDYNVA